MNKKTLKLCNIHFILSIFRQTSKIWEHLNIIVRTYIFLCRRPVFLLSFFFIFCWKKKTKNKCCIFCNIIIYETHETNRKYRIVYFKTKNTLKNIHYNIIICLHRIFCFGTLSIFNNRFQYRNSAQINIKIAKITIFMGQALNLHTHFIEVRLLITMIETIIITIKY